MQNIKVIIGDAAHVKRILNTKRVDCWVIAVVLLS